MEELFPSNNLGFKQERVPGPGNLAIPEVDSLSSAFLPNFRNTSIVDIGRLEEYGRFQQHLVLLEDEGRVRRYLEALSSVAPGDVVVDVGSGTGMLGIIALKCGFRSAILIEPSRKINIYARHLAELNGVLNRITFLESTLEELPTSVLPNQIDLIISETLSSVLFGFGCWDALPNLVRRVRDSDSVIPLKGTLYGCLAMRDYATRGSTVGGLNVLNRIGVKMDLFERTFRSGGNVYEKKVIRQDLSASVLKPSVISSFDFSTSSPFNLGGAELSVSMAGICHGLLLYWDVDLRGGSSPVRISSLDESVTSWYPFYVPFKQPLSVATNETIPVRMVLHNIDSPYPYALQFLSEAFELTNVLYW